MKKLIIYFLIISALIAISPVTASAEDCMHDPVYDRNWIAEVTTGARLRSIPCMETSEVLTTLPVGEVIKVIAETDGWYEIQRADGQTGWVGQWLIAATDKPFNQAAPEPPAPPEPQEPPALQAPLFDVTGHQNETAIRELYDMEIISGHPDGSFKPDDSLNRAELVKLLIEATVENFASMETNYRSECFPDIPSTEWYTPYVCYAKENKIVEGYPDGNFRPAQSISKVEAVKVVLESFDWDIPAPPSDFSFDDTSKTEWYAPHLEIAHNNGILEEESGKFFPSMDILRGGVSHIIYQALITDPVY